MLLLLLTNVCLDFYLFFTIGDLSLFCYTIAINHIFVFLLRNQSLLLYSFLLSLPLSLLLASVRILRNNNNNKKRFNYKQKNLNLLFVNIIDYAKCLVVLSNNLLASASFSSISIWNITNGNMINKFIHIDQVRSLAALPGGSLVSGLYNGQISIWTV